MKTHTEESEISSISGKNGIHRSFTVAPLSSTFMLASILGFLISVLYIPKLSLDWAFSFGMIFVLMFLASMVSMTRATVEEAHLDTLAIHEPKKHLKHLRKKD